MNWLRKFWRNLKHQVRTQVDSEKIDAEELGRREGSHIWLGMIFWLDVALCLFLHFVWWVSGAQVSWVFAYTPMIALASFGALLVLAFSYLIMDKALRAIIGAVKGTCNDS